MASELSFQASAIFTKGGASLSEIFATYYFDVAGSVAIKNVISVGTSDETIALGDISTIGWFCARNLDSTNFILAGADGTLYNNKMKALEPMFVRWNGAAIHVKANTAPCIMEYLIISD